MEEKNRINNRKIIITSIIIFFAILFLHRMIFMSFDDYGYAALSYAVGPEFNPNGGTNYSIMAIFGFLKKTYFIWAGRLLGQFMLIKSLQIGEWFIQLMQTIIIFFTLTIGIKVFSNNTKYEKKLMFVTAIFFCIPMRILQLSLFWYSASTIYFWEFVFFVLGLYLVEKEVRSNKETYMLILIFILGLCSGFSQEQVGLSFCAFMFVSILLDFKLNEKKAIKRKIIFLIAIIIGYIVLIAAPGNFVRMSADSSGGMLKKSLLEVIFTSLERLLPNLILVNKSIVYMLIVFFTTILLYKKEAKNTILERKKEILLVILVITELFILIDISQYGKAILYLIEIVNMISLFLGICLIAFLYNSKLLYSLIIGNMSSLLPILVSPYFVDRMLLPMYVFYVFILVAYFDLIIELKLDIKNQRWLNFNAIIIIGVIGYANIFYGYFENSIPKNLNNSILSQAKEKINEGQTVRKINLYRNLNEQYTGTQPYEIDYTYDIKRYFCIPQDVQIVFEKFPEKNVFKALYYIAKGGDEKLQESKFLSEINPTINSADISNELEGFYNLEKTSDSGFYWTEKELKCNLQNKKITQDGLSITLDLPKDSIIKANNGIDNVNVKLYINDKFIKDFDLKNGNQEIFIEHDSLPKTDNDKYTIQLESKYDFSPKDLGTSGDVRRLFAKIDYIGPKK